MRDLILDLRHGLRLLVRNPGFTTVAAFTLALGIGATSAMFTVVNAVLLAPLPYRDPARLVSVWSSGAPKGVFLFLRERMTSAELAAYTTGTDLNLSHNGRAVRIITSRVSGNLFPLLGANALVGRALTANDNSTGQDRVAVLSYRLWQREFGGDPNIVGRFMKVDDVERQIVGVMPPGFNFPDAKTDLWSPTTFNPASQWGNFEYSIIGRLHDGRTLAQARAELKPLLPQVIKAFPYPMPAAWGSWVEVQPLQQTLVSGVRLRLLLLMGAVAVLLLIACVNVANLLLARGASRQREIAIRSALGASRARVMRQFLTEATVLALAAGILGTALAVAGVRLLKLLLPAETPRLAALQLDARIFLVSLGVALLTALIFGIAPAWRAARLDIEATLRSTAPSAGSTRQRRRLSAALVVFQTALAVLLVLASGLLVRTVWALAHLDTGFRSANILTARLTPSSSLCEHPERCVAIFDEIARRAAALPGVEKVAIAEHVPFELAFVTIVAAERTACTDQAPCQVWPYVVAPGYFSTLNIPLVAGRDFNDSERLNDWNPSLLRTGTANGSVIISQKLAARLWPGQNPIGKRLRPSWQTEWRTVVGVVGDVRTFGMSPGDYADGTVGDIYYPHTQGIGYPSTAITLVLRSPVAASLAPVIPALVASVNSEIPVTAIRTLDDIVAASNTNSRSLMWLFVACGSIALVLAAVGVYSVMSHGVAQRTYEIGVRMALGAARTDVLRMVLREGAALSIAGIILGVVSALAAGRLIATFLYGVRPADPLTFIAMAIFTIAIALAATLIPARRASRVDPMLALRRE